MILKVQRPLFPEDKPEWLFYNKNQPILYEDISPVGVVGMMGDDLKMYVKARRQGNKIVIIRRAEDQPW